MKRLMNMLAVAVLSVALVGPTAAAPAATTAKKPKIQKVYKQCDQPKKLRKHSKKTLRRALRKMPKDVRQYTTCQSAIKKAIRKKSR